MNMLLKSSTRGVFTCGYGCCGHEYGARKVVQRRMIKRSERNRIKRALVNGEF